MSIANMLAKVEDELNVRNVSLSEILSVESRMITKMLLKKTLVFDENSENIPYELDNRTEVLYWYRKEQPPKLNNGLQRVYFEFLEELKIELPQSVFFLQAPRLRILQGLLPRKIQYVYLDNIMHDVIVGEDIIILETPTKKYDAGKYIFNLNNVPINKTTKVFKDIIGRLFR